MISPGALGSSGEVLLEIVISEALEVGVESGELCQNLAERANKLALIIEWTGVSPCGKSEISNCDIVTYNVLLGGVRLKSLLHYGEPLNQRSLQECLNEGGSRSLISEGSLVEGGREIVEGVQRGIDSPGILSIVDGVVTVLDADHAEDCETLSIELSFDLKGGDLTELELATLLDSLELGAEVVVDVFEGDVSVREGHSDAFSSAVAGEVMKLHLFLISFQLYLPFMNLY